MTDNKGSGSAAPLATTDKVFLLSATEVCGDVQSDGAQYEYYQSKGVTTSRYSGASSSGGGWDSLVKFQVASRAFRCTLSNGDMSSSVAAYIAANAFYVFPAFCF